MDNFDKKELHKLMSHPEGLCISIYIPTHRRGPEANQNQIRFKNALDQAETWIGETKDIDTSGASRILKPAKEKLASKSFWMKQNRGLAVFLAKDVISFYRTPLDFETLIIVSDRFHIKPLLPLFFNESTFYLVAVTLNTAQLFECCRYHIREIMVEDMPDGISDVLKYDLEYEQIQFHTGTGARYPSGKRAAVFHGQDAAEMENQEVLRYFQAIDKAIHPVLSNENRPLLFAGLDHFFPLYKQANTYPYLITDTALKKDPASMTEKQLQEQARKILEPCFKKEYRAAVRKYHNYKGTGKTGADLRQIIYRALTGRVDYLIVGVGVHQWGTYNEMTNEIAIHDRKEASDEDLLDFSAYATIMNGGKVYAVKPDEVPDNGSAVAFYRF